MNRMAQELDGDAYRLWCGDEGAARAFVAEIVTGEVFERFVNHPPDAPTEIGAVPAGLPLAVLPPAIAHGLNPILLFKATIARKQLDSRANDKNFGAEDYVQVQSVLTTDNLFRQVDGRERYIYKGFGANGKKYRLIIEQEQGRWVLVSFHRLHKNR